MKVKTSVMFRLMGRTTLRLGVRVARPAGTCPVGGVALPIQRAVLGPCGVRLRFGVDAGRARVGLRFKV